MSFNFDDLTVGGQAKFGTGMYLQTIKEGDHKINGSIGAEGKPEDIVKNESSYTGKYLAPLLISKYGSTSNNPALNRRIDWS